MTKIYMKQRAWSSEQGVWSREYGAGSREQGVRYKVLNKQAEEEWFSDLR